MLIWNDLEIILFITIIMENQNVLIASAGFAIAGVAGYMYLNRSDDVESENAKLGTTKLSDLTPDNLNEENKTNWWSSFWGQEHKKQKVMEELKETVDESLYN
jgi:hypothetical protein